MAKAPLVRRPILISAPHVNLKRTTDEPSSSIDHSSRGCSLTLWFLTVSNSATSTRSLASDSKTFLGNVLSVLKFFKTSERLTGWCSHERGVQTGRHCHMGNCGPYFHQRQLLPKPAELKPIIWSTSRATMGV